MAAPLLALQLNPETRTFALDNRAAKRLDQRLDVSEHDGCRCRAGMDGGKRLAVFGVHGRMIAKTAIKEKTRGGSK